MSIEVLISLGIYLVLMIAIGIYAYFKSTDTMSEYMLGGRQLSAPVAALSAGASDMSGWLLLGLPGAIFVAGLSEAWIAIGLIVGAALNYHYVAPRLRVYTEMARDAITIPDYFEKRFHDDSHLLRTLAAVVIIIFFTLYTSSGMVAGGKLFETSFGMDYTVGLFLSGGVVVAYTLFGGFLAVSLTDFVQGCIMFMALVLVPVVTLSELGGWGVAAQQISAVNPDFLSLTRGVTLIGVISAVSWGLGYFGQPHIIVRFMAVRSVKDVPMMRNIGMGWMIISLLGAVMTGLFGLAYARANGLAVGDPETIFIILSELLFHPYIAGFLLAAILAAVMSTISSQLLVSSSSLTEDVYKTFVRKSAGEKELVLVGRLCVLGVSIVAIVLAFDRSSTILDLVANAWAGFGAAFGPLVLLSLFWRGMTRNGAVAGMVTGALVVLFWIYAPVLPGGETLSSLIYEIVPGFIASALAVFLVSKLGAGPSPAMLAEFNSVAEKKADTACDRVTG